METGCVLFQVWAECVNVITTKFGFTDLKWKWNVLIGRILYASPFICIVGNIEETDKFRFELHVKSAFRELDLEAPDSPQHQAIKSRLPFSKKRGGALSVYVLCKWKHVGKQLNCTLQDSGHLIARHSIARSQQVVYNRSIADTE
jgi:hypothetical protein